jgi:hypothetical protein
MSHLKKLVFSLFDSYTLTFNDWHDFIKYQLQFPVIGQSKALLDESRTILILGNSDNATCTKR